MNTYKTDNYNPNYLIHPGATLAETLVSLGMSQAELSDRISRPEKTISEIINGVTVITPETAIQFERALGIPASFWNNLEKNYQELKARSEAKNKLLAEYDLAKCYPYNEISRLGWIPPTRKATEKVENLLLFFRVNSLSSIPKVQQVAFKKVGGNKCSAESTAVWLRAGEIEADKMATKDFNRETLLKSLTELRSLTTQNKFDDKMQHLCSEAGVALAFVPYLSKTYVNGATRWITSTKALVQLSLRGGFNDLFWFTFFHELGHILLHGKRDQFIETDTREYTQAEEDADKFASEVLIPTAKMSEFIKKNIFTIESIKDFAFNVNVHPGIVVGRLQHVGVIGYQDFTHLKSKYHVISH